MADNNNVFGNNNNMNINPNQRIAVNEAQIQRNNERMNYLGYNPYNNTGYGMQYGNQYPQQPQFLKCRPVTSIEEARAAQIDLDGSLWVFTDISHGKIYTKQIRNDGSSSFGIYNYTEEEPIVYNDTNNFVTKAELNKVIEYINLKLSQQTTANPPAETKHQQSNLLKF